jgi:hypothetical protein
VFGTLRERFHILFMRFAKFSSGLATAVMAATIAKYFQAVWPYSVFQKKSAAIAEEGAVALSRNSSAKIPSF